MPTIYIGPLLNEVMHSRTIAAYLHSSQAVDDYVTSGMVVGLGTGSTAAFAVERVGQKLASVAAHMSPTVSAQGFERYHSGRSRTLKSLSISQQHHAL